jgi:hypothetical protein
MTIVNNSMLARQGEVVFSNSSAYHVELPMAGRRAETEILTAALSAEGPRLVTMRAPLGAGKTFFLNAIIGQFSREQAKAGVAFDERRNIKHVFATSTKPLQLPDDPDDPGHPVYDDAGEHVDAAAPDLEDRAQGFEDQFDGLDDGLRLLIVEELDRKATLGQILWTVAGALRWLARGGDRLLVLTGDGVIDHPRVQGLVADVEQHSHIELAPLDQNLLLEALQARILDKVVTPADTEVPEDERAAAARAAAQQVIASEYVRWAAIPEAERNALATFREALGALRRVCSVAGATTEGVEFPPELVGTLRPDDVAPRGDAGTLAQALTDDVKRRIAASEPLQPLTVLELADLIGAEPSPRFRRRAVDALVRIGLLTPLGIPFSESDERGPMPFAEPFVASYAVVHRALVELVDSPG